MRKIISVILILSTVLSLHTVCFGQNSSDVGVDAPSTANKEPGFSNYNPDNDSETFENQTIVTSKTSDLVLEPPSAFDDDTTCLKVGAVLSGTLLVTTIICAVTASAIIFKDNIKKFFCEDLKDFYENGVKPAFTHVFKNLFKNLFKKKT